MDKVIGLGKLGCAIAEHLASYPEYRVYKIDSEIKERGSLSIGEYSGHDDYEYNLDQDEVAVYLRSIKKKDDVLMVVEGGDPISGAVLKILENCKRFKTKMFYTLFLIVQCVLRFNAEMTRLPLTFCRSMPAAAYLRVYSLYIASQSMV